MAKISHPEPAPAFGRRIAPYLLVWAVALVARAVYLWQIRGAPVLHLLMGDAVAYDAWAQRIANGDWLGHGVFYQAPLYPYFLGALYWLFGRNLLAVRLIQIVIGATSCGLLARAGRSFFGRDTGLVAGLILAIYPTAIFFDVSIQKSALDLFFLCALLVALGRLLEEPQLPWWAGAGIALGLFTLTRENALVLLPIVLTWLFVAWRGERWIKRLQWAGLFLAGLAAVLLPVAFRNLLVGGEFHLTTSQFGPNFYFGNGKDATGLYQALVYGHGSAEFERDDATKLAEQATGHKLTPAGVSRYWTAKALVEIREEPTRWLRLTGRKWLLAWNVSEVCDTEDQYTYGDWSPLLGTLNRLLNFGTICPLAVLGVCLTWPQRKQLWLLYAILLGYMASVALFYVYSRYRFPAVPLLVLFAAAGLTGLRDAIREARWRALGTGVLLAGTVALICGRPMVSEALIRSTTQYDIANSLLANHESMEEAAPYYREAIRLEPDFAAPYVGLGALLLREGQTNEALGLYEQALQVWPDYPEAHNGLGVVLAGAGQIDDAIAHFQSAARLNPDSVEAHRNLAILLAKQGRIDEAIAQVRSALKLEPDSKVFQEALDKLERVKAGGPGD